MNLPLDTDINEKTRDALVDFYLKQLVPASSFDRKIETPEDLYEYLLIDPEISSQVMTSYVASAISSLQTYVTDVSLNREPNVFLSKEATQTWQQVYQQYSIWAANQLLSLYPENYIDPSLRLSKTTLFQALETALSQGLLTEDTVQKAVFAYLNDFEKTSNLEIVSGFQTTPEINNAEIYFVGRTRIQPYEYYWRKVDMRQHDPADPKLIYPSAWSAWKKIELPIVNAVNSLVRPVFFKERLFIVWLSVQDEEDPTKPKVSSSKKGPGDSAVHSIRKLYLKLGFKKFDDSWSPTQSHSLLTIENTASGIESQGKIETQIQDLLVTTSQTDKPTILLGIYGEDDNKLFPAFYLLDELLTLTKESELKSFSTYPFHSSSDPKKSIVMPISEASYFVSNILLRRKHAASSGLPFMVLEDALGFSAKVILKNQKPILQIRVELLQFHRYVTEVKLVFTDPSDVKANDTLNLKTGFVSHDYILPTEAKGVLVYKVDCIGEYKPNNPIGEIEYEVQLKPEPTYKDSSAFIEAKEGVQWLTENKGSSIHIRLNTLFAKKLIRLANISIDALLHIFNQQTENEIEDQQEQEDLDFHGANGLYFWELFFYMPFLVAARLNQAQRFEQATHWLQYIFNPTKDNPFCWQVKVLLEDHNTTQQVGARLIAPSDPDSIASAHPIHYRKAIFRYYVNNLIDQGDALYRELTPDSLTEAKSYYMAAWRLLGLRPGFDLDSYWKPISLENAVAEENKALNTFALEVLKKNPPNDSYEHKMAFSADPTITNLTHGLFEKPINKLLLACWDRLESRLYNLRHNLTIDGKSLHLPLFAKPANPLQLLAGRNAGAGINSALDLNGSNVIPYYRFSVLIIKAQAAVDTLIQFGNNLLSVFERKDMRQWEKLPNRYP